MEEKHEKTGKLSGEINVGFFKINSEIEKKMRSLIVDYVVKPEQEDIQRLLNHFVRQNELPKEMIKPEDEKLLHHMARNNILYFDPTETTYYPQGRSYHWGIRLYFQGKRTNK